MTDDKRTNEWVCKKLDNAFPAPQISGRLGVLIRVLVLVGVFVCGILIGRVILHLIGV